MARTALTVQALTEFNKFATALDLTAITAAVDATSFEAEFTMSGQDTKYLILINNAHASAAKDVTIKAGNGLQGVADVKLTDLGAGKLTYIVLESGRFKNVSGADKGKVIILGESADIKVGVFKLP